MPAITEERLNTLKAQVIQLEKQRAENANNYSLKIRNLQQQELSLTESVKRLQQVIDSHVQEKQGQLDGIIAEVNSIRQEASIAKDKTKQLLIDAENKMNAANEVEKKTNESKAVHEQNIRLHVANVSSINSEIAVRHSQSLEREIQSKNILSDVQDKHAEVTAESNRVKVDYAKLMEIRDGIKADIETQKDLYFKNKSILDEVEQKKQESQDIQVKANQQMADAIKIRDDCDKAQARIETSSQEIIKRNDACKAREIQNQVIDQQLKDRKAFLDGKEGKLNELKNNIDTLQANLEKQQKGV